MLYWIELLNFYHLFVPSLLCAEPIHRRSLPVGSTRLIRLFIPSGYFFRSKSCCIVKKFPMKEFIRNFTIYTGQPIGRQ